MIDVTIARMRSQGLTGERVASPEAVVHRLGAVQCQDFGPGMWSIAQRTDGATQGAIDRLFATGAILRTHILRPTWHFVLPADIRWMLELTAPRVQAVTASFYRNQDLDGTLLERCIAVVAGALDHGHHLTRSEIADVLEQAGIPTSPPRLGAILMNAELTGVVCSGAPRGKQQTYALLAERAPEARQLSREEALAELTFRYFAGHGPATVKDLRWWSSLTMADIKQGLELVGAKLEQAVIDGSTYWFAPPAAEAAPGSPRVHLVQGYDEYIVGYGESKYLLDVSGAARSLPRARGIYTHSIILDGQVAGQWKSVPTKRAVIVEATLFVPLDSAQTQELRTAVQQYEDYVGLPTTLSVAG
jgi:hypothetical protein